jgi:hypothetical protein
MTLRTNLVVSAFLLASACATSVELGRASDSRQEDLREFQRLQAVFREQYSGQRQFDYEGHGRVTVREISLDGYPGNSYVRCRFHYQNRSARPVMQAWVSLDVLDGQQRVVATQSCRLILPTSASIERGMYYSEELRTPTYGAHLDAGWSWRIRLSTDAVPVDEPLDPPVEEWQPTRLPPMWIKDPSWHHRQQYLHYQPQLQHER